MVAAASRRRWLHLNAEILGNVLIDQFEVFWKNPFHYFMCMENLISH
jgi:hypothetical protein